jgi:nucleotide-binding universal stress UspA family protein
MYRNILVPVTGTAADAPVVAAAVGVARLSGGHLEFLHVRVDVTEALLAMTAGGMGGGGAVQEVVDRMDAEVKAAEARVWEQFGALCVRETIATDPRVGELSAELVVETGHEAQWVAEYGRFADLVVVGRGSDGVGLGAETVEAALMDTGRPLLIVPKTVPVLPGVVVIAWKDTPEAARAVGAALPLIDRAARVVVVTVAEGDAAPSESAAKLQRSLRWHNANTSVLNVAANGRAAVDALMAEAAALGASLVVMGGYSHSRLREVVFGGFTQRVLRDADVAVLMAH